MTTTKPLDPGQSVIIDGAVFGTFIGYAESGKLIIDLGYGTTLADPERVIAR